MPHRTVLLAVVFLLAACDSADPDPPAAGSEVPGIEVRTESNTFLGLLGNPVSEGPADGALRLGPAYPNPATHLLSVGYVVEQSTSVAMTIRSLPATAAFHSLVTGILPGFPTGSDAVVRTFPPVGRSPGLYELRWDGQTDSGAPAGAGYYRIEFSAGVELHTVDVMLTSTEDDMLALRGAAGR